MERKQDQFSSQELFHLSGIAEKRADDALYKSGLPSYRFQQERQKRRYRGALSARHRIRERAESKQRAGQ